MRCKPLGFLWQLLFFSIFVRSVDADFAFSLLVQPGRITHRSRMLLYPNDAKCAVVSHASHLLYPWWCHQPAAAMTSCVVVSGGGYVFLQLMWDSWWRPQLRFGDFLAEEGLNFLLWEDAKLMLPISSRDFGQQKHKYSSDPQTSSKLCSGRPKVLN